VGTVRKVLKSLGLISNDGAGTEALLFAGSERVNETHCRV